MKIAVMGVAGRMGQELVRAVARANGCSVCGAIERPGSPIIGADAGTIAGLEPIGVKVTYVTLEVIF
jgi:4-hydroxy-tetrahydrodipicolinate reductase